MRSRKDRRTKFGFVFAALAAGLVLSFSVAAFAGPWVEHMTKISSLKRQTDDLEIEIKHLIEEKRAADDETKVRSMTLELAEKYKSLKETADKLEAELNHVRFKHPAQAETLDHKYVRFKLKSMHDLESEVGIDGKLDRVKQHVLATFPIPVSKDPQADVPKVSPLVRRPASVDEPELPEKIILKK